MTTRLTNSLKNQLLVFLVIAALTIATPEFAGRAEAQDDSGFYFMLEGRFGLTDGDETVYAERHIVGPGLQGVEDIDTEFGGGGRIGGAYRTGRWDFGFFYSGFHVSGDADSLADIYVSSFVLPVLGASYFTFESVDVEADATYHVLDFEAGYNMKLGQADIRLFGGLRYANFDQDVNPTFFGTAGRYIVVEKREVHFWGVGFRLGASAHKPLSGPWGVAGAISGAVLFGEQDTLTTQNITFGQPSGFGNTRVSRSDGRTAWNVDGELGVTYSREMANAMNMVFTLGYRAEGWFDVNNTQNEPLTFRGVSSGNIYGTMYADQIFHGPFLRGEWRFK